MMISYKSVFTNTNAVVLHKNSIYIIFHGPSKRNFRYIPETRQFKQIQENDCDWTTRYLLCQYVIFNQMTNQTTYVRQGSNEQMISKQFNDL